MECSCEVFDGLDEDCCIQTLKCKLVESRKTFQCCECGIKMPPGTKHEYFSGRHDGGFLSFRTCMDCLALRIVFFKNGWFYEQIWDDFREFLRDGNLATESCISALPPVARGKVCDLIQSMWRDDEDE
jgi:hypothetical protein